MTTCVRWKELVGGAGLVHCMTQARMSTRRRQSRNTPPRSRRLKKTKRETTLDVWRLLRDYNGWPANLEGGFANTSLTTLDANPTGTETVM